MLMADVDAQPCMCLIAQKAKVVVKNNFKNSRSDIEPIFSILNKRWDKHFDKPLFSVGAFSNPSVIYSMDSWDDSTVDAYEQAFQACVRKMVDDPTKRTRILLDSQTYKSKLDNFASIEATHALDQAEPRIWWETFGVSTTELRKIAVRILSLCCSASSCERNWSTFEHIQSKKRCRLESNRISNRIMSTTTKDYMSDT